MHVFRAQYKDRKTGKMKTAIHWRYEFFFAGKRIRENSHSPKKTIAIAAGNKRKQALENGLNDLTDRRRDRIQTVSEVADQYFKDYEVRHPDSVSSAEYYVHHLKRLIGGVLVVDVTDRVVMDFQNARVKEGAAPKTINDEVGCLLRILEERGDLLAAKMKRQKTLKLRVQNEIGHAYTPGEKDKLIAAAKKLRSRAIYPALMLNLHTGLRKKETRTLLWSQVDLVNALVVTKKAKTRSGENRPIPLNADVMAALTEYTKWYLEKFGKLEPTWYVFPYGQPQPTDPTRPVTDFKTAWATIKTNSGVVGRWHDGRHTWKTDLGSNPANSEQTIKNMGGWSDTKMLQRYGHTSLTAMREAVTALEKKNRKVASGGKNTKVQPPASPPATRPN